MGRSPEPIYRCVYGISMYIHVYIHRRIGFFPHCVTLTQFNQIESNQIKSNSNWIELNLYTSISHIHVPSTNRLLSTLRDTHPIQSNPIKSNQIQSNRIEPNIIYISLHATHTYIIYTYEHKHTYTHTHIYNLYRFTRDTHIHNLHIYTYT